MRRRTRSFLWLSTLAAALVMSACFGSSSDDPTTAGTSTDQTFTGPGSYWEALINEDLSFTLTMSDSVDDPVELTVSGTYERLDSGFLLMTVSSSTGTDGPEAGEQAVAIEIPGFALILKPLGGDEVIPMLISGTCPSADFTANWLVAQNTSDRPADEDRDWFGTFAYDADTNTASLPAKYSLLDEFPVNDEGDENFPDLACDNGFMQIIEDGVAQANMWLTSNGGAMVETRDTDADERESTIIALPAEELSSLAAVAGNYAGIVLMGSELDSDEGGIFPVTVTLDADGDGTAFEFDPVTDVADAEEGVVLNLGNANLPSNGWLTGTIAAGAEQGNIACSVVLDLGASSLNTIFCVGQDPGDNAEQFAVMLVEDPA